MFKGKVSAVKGLMVLGKSLILALAISSNALANDIFQPKFFEYSSNNVVSRMLEFGFGWGKKLNESEKSAYYQSIVHAVEVAENGQRVNWYKGNASGYSVPVMTWPTGSGYCRRIHLSVTAFNKNRSMAATACHNNVTSNWTWYTDK